MTLEKIATIRVGKRETSFPFPPSKGWKSRSVNVYQEVYQLGFDGVFVQYGLETNSPNKAAYAVGILMGGRLVENGIRYYSIEDNGKLLKQNRRGLEEAGKLPNEKVSALEKGIKFSLDKISIDNI